MLRLWVLLYFTAGPLSDGIKEVDKMEKDRLGPLCSVIGTFSFIIFGIVGFMNLSSPFDLFNVIFGIISGVLFGFVGKFVFTRLLSILNGDIGKAHGKKAIKAAVRRSTIFMFPYAILALLSAYFLGWAASAVFFSAGIMSTGVMASGEISKLKGRNAVKNNIATSLAASAVSYFWMFSAGYLLIILSTLETVVKLALSSLGVKI